MKKYNIFAILQNFPEKKDIIMNIKSKPEDLKGSLKPYGFVSHLDYIEILNRFVEEIGVNEEKKKKVINKFREDILKNLQENSPLSLLTISNYPIKDIPKEIEMKSFTNGIISNFIDPLILTLSFNYSVPIKLILLTIVETENQSIFLHSSHFGLIGDANINEVPKEDIGAIIQRLTKLYAWEFKEKTNEVKKKFIIKKALEIYYGTLYNVPSERIGRYWNILTILSEKYKGKSLIKKVELMFKEYGLKDEFDKIEPYWKIRGSWEHFRENISERDINSIGRDLKSSVDKILMAVLNRLSEEIRTK